MSGEQVRSWMTFSNILNIAMVAAFAVIGGLVMKNVNAGEDTRVMLRVLQGDSQRIASDVKYHATGDGHRSVTVLIERVEALRKSVDALSDDIKEQMNLYREKNAPISWRRP